MKDSREEQLGPTPTDKQLRESAIAVLNQLGISADVARAFMEACNQDGDEKVVETLRERLGDTLEDTDNSDSDSVVAEIEEDRLPERDRWVDNLKNAETLNSQDFFRKRKPILDRAQAGEYFKLETKIEKKYIPVAVLGPYEEDIHSQDQVISSARLDAGGNLLRQVISGKSFVLDRKGQRLAYLEPFPSDSILSLSADEIEILRIARKYTANEIARIVRGEVSPVDMLRHRIKQ